MLLSPSYRDTSESTLQNASNSGMQVAGNAAATLLLRPGHSLRTRLMTTIFITRGIAAALAVLIALTTVIGHSSDAFQRELTVKSLNDLPLEHGLHRILWARDVCRHTCLHSELADSAILPSMLRETSYFHCTGHVFSLLSRPASLQFLGVRLQV